MDVLSWTRIEVMCVLFEAECQQSFCKLNPQLPLCTLLPPA
ncbi:hypothetical protein RSPO_m00061 (plasmid) [Ralstonia solanacearum Po82]|uniref:Uncharacterized protein n=1 Tax=Ralstonia solanacearum (strain Po82) TaxID=1031711 RepID=F6G739_RALS8|nr:hypothetical protein RSPO_m00061 [Ralstonia solanacearum Po82]